jgi:hypothetical protein
MTSEWMKVMLEEIARKQLEAEQMRTEERTRATETARSEEQYGVIQSAACTRR